MKCLLGLFLAMSISVSAQDPLAYKWFSATGKKSSFEQLVQATAKADGTNNECFQRFQR